MSNGITLPSHRKKHFINSIKDHIPVTGDHDENAVVVMDANGLPVKDSGIQLSTLLTGLSYVDEWDASGGTYPIPTKVGNFWTISVSGTIGGIDYALHDWLVYVDDTPLWKKIDNTDVVTSVDGQFGDVDLSGSYEPLGATDRNCGQIWVSTDFGDDATGDGGINKPLATIQEAITQGSVLYDYIEIIIDQSVGRDLVEPMTVPSGKMVSVMGTTWGYGNSNHYGINVNLLAGTLGSVMNNCIINNITGGNFTRLDTEQCYIKGTISAIKLLYCMGTIIDFPSGAKIDGFWYNASEQIWILTDNLFLNTGDAENEVLTKQTLKDDITLAGETPVDADVLTWSNGSKGIGIGTTGRVFWMHTTQVVPANPIVKYVELS